MMIGLTADRTELYRRTDNRVDEMIARGLVEEVEKLVKMGYSLDLPSMSGIGYRQVCAYLRGEMTLAEVVAKVKTETHRLARMQYTWFRRDDQRILWLDASSGKDVYEDAAAAVRQYLKQIM